MFKLSERDYIATRRAFWSDKAENARHCAAMDRAIDSATRERNQTVVTDWLSRFHSARNAACDGQKNFRGVGF